MATAILLKNYLSRIGYEGPVAPDLETFSALHAAHVGAIPFEGLAPWLRQPVHLDIDSIQRKLVDSRRGGYCFEQNCLFKAALETIGFRVIGLTARVRWMAPSDAPLGPREHMLLIVDLPDGRYLADVGFGACVLDRPLVFAPGLEQRTAMGTFRLTESDGLYWLSARQGDEWRVMYAFDLHPRIQADYELGNWYASTSPNPPFQSIIIIERVGPDARHKLINQRFITEARDGVVREERILQTAEELGEVLAGTFNIEPPVPCREIFARLSSTG